MQTTAALSLRLFCPAVSVKLNSFVALILTFSRACALQTLRWESGTAYVPIL